MKYGPIIKFNGGSPIALCHRCFTIMCYVTCDDEGNCKVKESYNDNTTATNGDKIPQYCRHCNELLKYTLNE